MSPEQVLRRRADRRADVWSLGATLYELLTLRAPFEGESEFEIESAITFDDPVPPRRLNRHVSPDLETIVLTALEKNPQRRYQTAGEFADDLGRFLNYKPILAKPPGLVRQMQHQRFAMPRDLAGEFRELADRVRICSLELIKAVRELFDNYHNAMFLADRVGELESEADDAEFDLIGKIFASSHDTADKILLRDMTQAIGSIADRAEDASDRIRIIAVKRKI